MSATTEAPRPAGEWLSIREASQIVGVSVATLRRWCDAGEVHAFTTPGGHRRFARSAVLGLARSTTPAKRVGCDGETRARIIRAYRREQSVAERDGLGLEQLSEGSRRQLRQHGSAIVGALVEAIDADLKSRSCSMSKARVSAAACARLASRDGLTLQEALALFIRFRQPFLRQVRAVARGQDRDAGDATALLMAASDALDELLPAVVEGYGQASTVDGR